MTSMGPQPAPRPKKKEKLTKKTRNVSGRTLLPMQGNANKIGDNY